MKRYTRAMCLIAGALMMAVGVALPPAKLLDVLMPPQAAAYYDKLLAGLWCLKVVLAVDGLLVVLFPWLKRYLWDVNAQGDAPHLLFNHPDPGPCRGVERWVVAGIFGLALALRLVGANQSLWGDEIAVQQMFVSRGLPVIFTYFPYTPQHVLYSLLAWAAQKLPLPIEIGYRLPAILFGSGAAALTYVLARRVVSRFMAAIVGLLASVSLFGIAYSHTAKSYSTSHFATLAASLGIVAICRNWRKPFGWIMFWGSLAALGYCHLYNVYLCVGLVVTLAVLAWRVLPTATERWTVFRRLVLVLGVLGAVLLLLYSLQLPQILDQMRRVSSQPEEKLTVRFLRSWLMQLTFWGRAWPLALMFLALALAGAVSLFRRERNVVLLLLLPVSVVLLSVAASRSWIYPRYLVFTLPVFLILLVEGSRLLACSLTRLQSWAVLAVAVLFVFATVPVLTRYYRLGYQNIRGGVMLAQSHAGDGDVLASYGLARDLFPFYDGTIVEIDSLEDLDRVIQSAQPHRVLLMYAWRRSWPNRQDEFEAIHRRFTTLGEFDGFAMDLDERDGEVVVLASGK